MQLYYEIHGQGKPMVLLHGGITAFEGLGTNIDALAKSRQVIAVHLQGHGNTAEYQNLLTLWKDADPDIPIYQQAKAEYARLR